MHGVYCTSCLVITRFEWCMELLVYGVWSVWSMELLVYVVWSSWCMVYGAPGVWCMESMEYGAPGVWSILRKLPCNHRMVYGEQLMV